MANGSFNKSSADCAQFENVLSEENRQCISNLVHMVQSLSDVEKLVLYMKLPVGTPAISQYKTVNNSLDNQFNTPGAVHLCNQLEQGQAYTWIMSHLEEDSNTCLRKDEVYDDYKFYCESHGLKSLNTADFGKIMKRAFPNVKPRRLGQRGQSKYCYGGLRKNVELQPPSLPNISSEKLANDFKENGDGTNNSGDLKDECAQIILEWADQMIGTQFSTLLSLAEFLVNNKYVNGRSKAAFSVISVMHTNHASYKTFDDPQLFTEDFSRIQRKNLQGPGARATSQCRSYDNVQDQLQADDFYSRTPQRSVMVKAEQLSPQQLFSQQTGYLSPEYQCNTRTSNLGSQHSIQQKTKRCPFGLLTKPQLLQLPHHITKEAFRGQVSSPASPKLTTSLHGGTPLTPTGVLHHSQNNQQMGLPCMWPSYSAAAQHHTTPPSAHLEQQTLLPPLHYLGPVPLPPPLAVTTSPYTPVSSKRAPPGQYDESVVTASSTAGSASPAKRLRMGLCFEQENIDKNYERYSLDQPGSGYHTGLLSPRLSEDCSPVQDWMSAVEVPHTNSSMSFFCDLPTSSVRDSPGCQHRAFHSPIHIPNTINTGSDLPQFPPVSPTGFLSSLNPSSSSDLPRIGLSPQPSAVLRAVRRPSPMRMADSPCRSSSTSVNPGSPQPLTSPESPAAAAFPLYSLRHGTVRSSFAQVPRKSISTQGKENAPVCQNADLATTSSLDCCRNEDVAEDNVVDQQRSELNTPTPPLMVGVNCSPEFSTVVGSASGLCANSVKN